jgi:hypothetical protein
LRQVVPHLPAAFAVSDRCMALLATCAFLEELECLQAIDNARMVVGV